MLTLLLALCWFDVSPSPAAGPKPNIVVIISDDAGWSDFGFQGSSDVPTPNLDALRASGVRFERGYVTASVCSPSRAGLLSGQYQQRFGHDTNMPVGSTHGMPGSVVTLAERLHDVGYATAAVGKWHLGYQPEMRPLQQGFDTFHGQLAGSRKYTPYPKDQKRSNYRQRIGDELIEDEAARFEWVTEYFGETAAGLITELSPSRPFFLYVAFTAPHTPMQASTVDLDAVGGEPSKRKTYRAMQRALDRAVGDILQAIEGSGEADNTIVWFVNDNGGATTNASDNGVLRGMKGSAFEGGIRVPMLVRWPGVTSAGASFSHPVSTLDIAASVVPAAAGGIEGFDGVDLRPFLVGVSEAAPHKHLFWKRGPIAAMIEGDQWKLIRVGDDQLLLFDLKADPSERTDVGDANPAVRLHMAKALAAWAEAMPAPSWFPSEKMRENQLKKHQPDVDTRAKERSLP